jgi:hypothetical protein
MLCTGPRLPDLGLPECDDAREQFRTSAVQATSKMASTSTAASNGNAATPTVVRAWRPLSPNAATIKSDAPFSTFGPSRKSGAELTKPTSLTTRVTLSRSRAPPWLGRGD